MTDEEADAKQRWAGMDGAIAFHLIERHADDWYEAGAMMHAWLRANSASATSSKPATEDTALGSSAPPPCPTA